MYKKYHKLFSFFFLKINLHSCFMLCIICNALLKIEDSLSILILNQTDGELNQTDGEQYWFPNWEENGSINDGKSKKFEADLKIPKYLMNCRPVQNTPCYVHAINITAQSPNLVLPRKLRSGNNSLTFEFHMGIITKNALPPVCDFLSHTDVGKVYVKIDTNNKRMKFDESKIKIISTFHRSFFLKVLQIIKKSFLYNKDDTNGYFIVPLLKSKKNKINIDWKMLLKQSQIQVMNLSSEQKHEAGQYPKENQYFVVTGEQTNTSLDSILAIIPLILNRLNNLLLAEEIREKISIEAGVGNPTWVKESQDFFECAEVNEEKIIKSMLEKSTTSGKVERFLTKMLEKKSLLINLERRKTISLDDIEKFVQYIWKKLDVENDTTMEEELWASKHLNYFPKYNEPPSLSTLKEHSNYEGPRQHQILEALTPVSCQDIINSEKLITLGDAFLKFSTAFTIFTKYPTANEGYMATLKDKLTGNRNLLYCGNRLNLGSYFKITRFSPHKNWCPPGFVIPKPLTQSISGKCVADAVKALVGVYAKTGGIKPAFRLLNYFNIIANPTYGDIIEKQSPSPLLSNIKFAVENLVPNYQKLEELLEYKFNDKAHIVQALSHPTYLKNNITGCYQTVEFIGDAVLDFLITSYILEYCGNLSLGKINDLKTSLVNRKTFGAFVARLGLHKFLLMNDEKLTDVLNRFIEYQEQKNHEIHGNEFMIILSDNEMKMAQEVEIPKVLGDIFESVAGAIFLDSGNDLKTVWRVYYNIMKEEIKKFSENIPMNPIKVLYELPGLKIEYLNEMLKTGEDAKPKGFLNGKLTIPLRVTKDRKEFLYYGMGENTDLCKRAAAKLALKDLGINDFHI